ncbi:MAG TPA: alpha/beta fold hydrolase [Polyangiaceae bacterium]
MSSRLLLFAHGAGAGSAHPWMRRWAEGLGALGTVECFDYPYIARGSRRPDPLPKLVDAHAAALAKAVAAHAPEEVVLVGKSMGSRVGCHLACQSPVDKVVCFGYPLRTPSGKLRDQVLRALTTPVLFIQGARDALCPLELLDGVRKDMQAENELLVVAAGDHSLSVASSELKRRNLMQSDVDAEILARVTAFVTRR